MRLTNKTQQQDHLFFFHYVCYLYIFFIFLCFVFFLLFFFLNFELSQAHQCYDTVPAEGYKPPDHHQQRDSRLLHVFNHGETFNVLSACCGIFMQLIFKYVKQELLKHKQSKTLCSLSYSYKSYLLVINMNLN